MKGPTPAQVSWLRAMARVPDGKVAPVNEPSLRALERLGLVQQTPNGHRSRIWTLTPQGLAYLEENPAP